MYDFTHDKLPGLFKIHTASIVMYTWRMKQDNLKCYLFQGQYPDLLTSSHSLTSLRYGTKLIFSSIFKLHLVL